MSDWFFMLGEPLSAAERSQAADYLRGLGILEHVPVESVPDFSSASRIIQHPDWDRRWWDAEQRERERLRAELASSRGDEALLRALSRDLERSMWGPYAAAAIHAARLGCADAGLTRAAAGALSEALYLKQLAELAGAVPSHPFVLKHALFAGGHWPLGVVNGGLYVF